jgi:signal transduction histidine kinase
MATPTPALPQDNPGEWMTTLGRVMARVTAGADRENVLDVLCRAMVEEFGIVLARIWLFDPADDMLHLRASAGHVDGLSGAFDHVSAHDSGVLLARAVEQRAPLIIDDLLTVDDMRDPAWVHRTGMRGYACFPLLIGDRIGGAMVAFLQRTWPPHMVDTLRVLAQQAALAVEHARLLDESHTLQGIAAELASARDTQALLDGIVQRTMTVLGAEACAVWLMEVNPNRLTAGAALGLSDQFLDQIIGRRGLNKLIAFNELRRTGRPLFSRDAAADAREQDPVLGQALADEGIVSALRLPLFEPGQSVIGMLALYHRRERYYSDSEIRLAQTFTDQIAVALQNVRLADKEREAREAAARQVERLAALAEITERLLASTDIDAVLNVVVGAAGRLCGASMSMVGLHDPERNVLYAAVAEGEARRYFMEEAPEQLMTEEYLRGTATGLAFSTGQTVVIEDYATWPVVAEAQATTMSAGARALLAAPMMLGGTAIGVLWVADTVPRVFAPEDVALLEALADQAALAIEHARLARRSQEVAVLEERSRLARDLHDSVTQSIFSLSMMARAAQAQHKRGVPALAGTLDRIGSLAQQALTEMRTLLFELRPSVLAEEGLGPALEKLAEATRVRSDLPVIYRGHADIRLPADVETAMFRIGQEALNNAAKHAGASDVSIELAVEDGRVRVTVTDNGAGFDPDAVANAATATDGRTGGLGMRTMRERAAAAGLTLEVFSAVGAGTRVSIVASIPDVP